MYRILSLFAFLTLLVAPNLARAQAANCPQGTGIVDGCSNASTGTIQKPNIRAIYGANFPTWNVPDVDYAVGINSGKVLTDWRNLGGGQGLSQVGSGTGGAQGTRCSGAGAITVDSVDFTLHGGGYIDVETADSCTSIIITNSKFGCSVPNAGGPSTVAMVINKKNIPVTFQYNEVDLAHCTQSKSAGGTQVISSAGPVTIQYIRLKCSGPMMACANGQLVNLGQTATNSVSHLVQYNSIQDMSLCSSNDNSNEVNAWGVHQNYQQAGAYGTTNNVTYSFNFSMQKSCAGAEGPQFYANVSGNIATAILKNNVDIALANLQTATLPKSYLYHGGTVTTGTVCDNYVDISGATGAFYPASLTSAQGWTGTCTSAKPGVNMKTGATINPT